MFNSEVELYKDHDTIKCIYQDSDARGNTITQTIPIARLNSIETYGNVKISSPLLQLCNELKVPCYFNTYHGKPIGTFVPENPKPSIIRLNQYETFLEENKKLLISKALVCKATEERIRIQEKFQEDNSLKKNLKRIDKFKKQIGKVKSVPQLRGLEGNIMKEFFKSFSTMLRNLPFAGRSQQPPKDEGNAILSYGNVILYNTVRAVIYRCGLDPLVGFLHEPHENRNSLALDIAEIFRPIIVDNLILRLDHKNNLNSNHFEKDVIKCHLNEKGKKIWIRHYKKFLHSSIYYPPLKRNISVREEIKLECYNLIKYISNENKVYSPLHFNNN
ncbi:MAG: CRISPR-associated endonuclease Cas1 [Candidatus Lokiarchaeota archaeon]|nr:CRISPR-associated endonuclease Cas1 [Candidatus Lokiarchaeota archaeon]MBD3342644.1 CRISPR-associated endonuclease Cas1 [Candidatus Lokiarchaeota archaeon]